MALSIARLAAMACHDGLRRLGRRRCERARHSGRWQDRYRRSSGSDLRSRDSIATARSTPPSGRRRAPALSPKTSAAAPKGLPPSRFYPTDLSWWPALRPWPVAGYSLGLFFKHWVPAIRRADHGLDWSAYQWRETHLLRRRRRRIAHEHRDPAGRQGRIGRRRHVYVGNSRCRRSLHGDRALQRRWHHGRDIQRRRAPWGRLRRRQHLLCFGRRRSRDGKIVVVGHVPRKLRTTSLPSRDSTPTGPWIPLSAATAC